MVKLFQQKKRTFGLTNGSSGGAAATAAAVVRTPNAPAVVGTSILCDTTETSRKMRCSVFGVKGWHGPDNAEEYTTTTPDAAPAGLAESRQGNATSTSLGSLEEEGNAKTTKIVRRKETTKLEIVTQTLDEWAA